MGGQGHGAGHQLHRKSHRQSNHGHPPPLCPTLLRVRQQPLASRQESQAERAERHGPLLDEQPGKGDRQGLQPRRCRIQEAAGGQRCIEGTQGGIRGRRESVRIELGERTEQNERQEHPHRERDSRPTTQRPIRSTGEREQAEAE